MRVGTVVGLWRYPVKSMAGQTPDEVDASWHGFAGDRRWAFLRDGVPGNGFPWLTIRQRADLCRYRPWFADAKTLVTTPQGRESEVIDPELAAHLGARAMKLDRGTFARCRCRSSAPAPSARWKSAGSGRTCWSTRRGRPRTRGSGACCGSAVCGCVWTGATSGAPS